MRCLLLVAVSTAACQAPSDLPWIRGLEEVTSSTERSSGSVPDDEQLCAQPDAYGRIELVADVTPDPGREHVVASYADGLQIRDRGGKLLASFPGSSCEGSRDAATALAIARVDGARTIVVALASGGRVERTTRIDMLQLSPGRGLVRVFSGVVEEIRGDEVRIGTLVVLPGRLMHGAPDGATTTWTFDPRHRAFVLDAGPEHPPQTMRAVDRDPHALR